MSKKNKSVITNTIGILNKRISIISTLLMNVFVLSIISGLLFNDPFGTIKGISIIISNIDDNGISGLISLLVIVIWHDYIYRGKR